MDHNTAISRRTCLSVAALASLSIPAHGIAMQECDVVQRKRSVSPFDYGAIGDGLADDTKALQSALDAIVAAGGGSLCLPSARYRLTKPVQIKSATPLSIRGEGYSTVLLHEFDDSLLTWPAGIVSTHVFVSDIAVVSTGRTKSPETPVFLFPGGLTFCAFSNVILDGSLHALGSGIVVRGLIDTCAFTNCLIWRAAGIGFDFGHGSEVRISGGRVVGIDTRREGNIGVLLRGGNGGVHLSETDLIHVHTGMQIGLKTGVSNREIFLTHVTFDSSTYGLRQLDHSYTSIVGCWAASSDEAQIILEASASGALLLVAGGTIFNGGAYERGGANHGIVVKAGSFSLQGVSIRHNKGTGVLVESAAKNYVVQGCRIHNNGVAAELRGSGYQFTQNILYENKKPVVDAGRKPKRVGGNLVRE